VTLLDDSDVPAVRNMPRDTVEECRLPTGAAVGLPNWNTCVAAAAAALEGGEECKSFVGIRMISLDDLDASNK
jgi:hypothetical protein